MAPEAEAATLVADGGRDCFNSAARSPLLSEESSDSSGEERSLSDSDDETPEVGEARSRGAFTDSAGPSFSVGKSFGSDGFSADPSRPGETETAAVTEFDGATGTLEFETGERIEEQQAFDKPEHAASEKAKVGWLLKRNGGRRPASLAHCALGTWLQSLFWQRRYFRIGKDELMYRLREGTNDRGAFGLEHVDQVAVMDSKIWIHFAHEQRTGVRRRRRESLCLAAMSHAEAESWAEALRFAVAGLRTGLPTDWDVREMLRGEAPGASNESVRLVAKKQLGEDAVVAMQKLMDHAFVCKRTQDRKGMALPLRMEVVQVFGVQNISAWTEYAKARAAISGRIALSEAGSGEIAAATNASLRAESLNRPPPGEAVTPLVPKVRTSTIQDKDVWDMLGEVQDAANEHWLFHGSTPGAVQSITDSEFRINLAGSHRGTLYGKGVYLAECCSKADEYAEAGDDKLYGMLVCRAALGRILVETARRPAVAELEAKCMSGEYDSLCGDRWVAANTFREFVIYDGRQVYPAFMVFYRRWNLQHLLASLRLALSSDVEEADPDYVLRLALYTARIAEHHPNEMVSASIRNTLRSHPELAAHIAASRLAESSETNRRRLVALLGTLGYASEEVTANLSLMLKDAAPDVRAIACASLSVLGKAAFGAVPLMEELLSDSSAEVRAASAAALGAFAADADGDAAAEVLLKAAEADLARAPVVASLGGLQRHAPRVLPLLSRALVNDCDETRSAAASALLQLRHAARPLAGELQQALSDELPDVRRAVVEALGLFGSKLNWVASDLAKCLQDSDEGVAVAAARGLGKCGKTAAGCIPQLSATLHSDNVPVRLAVLGAFAQLGAIARSAMPSVCFMLHDPRADVVEAAQAALQSMGDRPSPFVGDFRRTDSGLGGDGKCRDGRSVSKDNRRDRSAKKPKDKQPKEKKEGRERRSSADRRDDAGRKAKKEKKEKKQRRNSVSKRNSGEPSAGGLASNGHKDRGGVATIVDSLAGLEDLPAQPPSSSLSGSFLARWSL